MLLVGNATVALTRHGPLAATVPERQAAKLHADKRRADDEAKHNKKYAQRMEHKLASGAKGQVLEKPVIPSPRPRPRPLRMLMLPRLHVSFWHHIRTSSNTSWSQHITR